MPGAARADCWATQEPDNARIIGTLPLELFRNIVARLSTVDLGALRLTCRAMERQLFGDFVGEFFVKKQFMIARISLAALRDISRSRLGPHLRRLHIGMEHFPPGRYRPISDEKETRYWALYAESFALWAAGGYERMLVEAFRHLPNLEDVVLRSFNSPTRFRDDSAWRSYGSTTIFRQTGVRLRQPTIHTCQSSLSVQYCNQVTALVLRALGTAGSKPKGFQVLARPERRLREYDFIIPRCPEASTLPVLDSLERLHLSLDFLWSSGADFGVSWNREYLTSRSTASFVRILLRHCLNLRDLRISEAFATFDADFSAGRFLQWLGAGTDEEPPAPALPGLQDLSLDFMNVQAG
ncbi:hypothetical protein RJ55_08351 [Drechmeria coniospora]|nr:hypothetical protein RJ55_08351 [Drechmeria coniospora]